MTLTTNWEPLYYVDLEVLLYQKTGIGRGRVKRGKDFKKLSSMHWITSSITGAYYSMPDVSTTADLIDRMNLFLDQSGRYWKLVAYGPMGKIRYYARLVDVDRKYHA